MSWREQRHELHQAQDLRSQARTNWRLPQLLEDVVGSGDRAHAEEARKEGGEEVSDEEIDAWLDSKTTEELLRYLVLSTLYLDWRGK
jgi:hypothetical protein